jgi:hypothetical protein
MSMDFVTVIVAEDVRARDVSLDALCEGMGVDELLEGCREMEKFRRESGNLYHRVRALFFLYAIHRFHLPRLLEGRESGGIPFAGYEQLLQRRFEEAIDEFLESRDKEGAGDAICSALAGAYHALAFQTLADQVRASVRTVDGNRWMFRMGHPEDHPLRFRKELLERCENGTFPILRETTPVRMDLTHSAWSDIFFLGMDFPEGARVVNVSVDLGVHGRDARPSPPVEAYLRVIEKPVIRLTSVDLDVTTEVTSLGDVFDFAKDYLGLLKAAVIASGVVPPGIEGSGQTLEALLERLVGAGRGIELVSSVNDIPKGSRLAVSTNLLAALISACMRATGQTGNLTGELDESERRIVLARAILGEWIGGSGGGWQDSGGVWPGIKLIEGALAGEGDPEYGISRGRLMPRHKVFGEDEIPQSARDALQASLVLVHGGMAQNVGPILEMVTEKYLLRGEKEWLGRRKALDLLDQVVEALSQGDIRRLGGLTMENFRGPIQTIIPWATTLYTEELIAAVEGEFGNDFWGFWMLGGMSGGGMGFIFAPERKGEGQEALARIMRETKARLQDALPFAMEPVVYDFAINARGTYAELLSGSGALLPRRYYKLRLPSILREDPRGMAAGVRAELDCLAAASRNDEEYEGLVRDLFDSFLPRGASGNRAEERLEDLLRENGFDEELHERIRNDLRSGRIGLAQNRLPNATVIEDVRENDVRDFRMGVDERLEALGAEALAAGSVAVVSLAAGAGSRWTRGAGVCKALNPFAKMGGRHRSFLETHLAKSRRVSRIYGVDVPHVFTTSYLTHAPMEAFLGHVGNYGYGGEVVLSRGKSVGLRMIPMERDLRFAWEEMPQQILDEQQQKVRDSLRMALISWANGAGEGGDYRDNVALQCMHPVGHFFEVPNMLRNGVLAGLLRAQPGLKTLFLHNIDTLGADLDAGLLGAHLDSGAGMTFEVISRRLEDRGGGLARVNGQVRLVEGLAMPNEEDEFVLSYYNTLSCWIDIDQFLARLELSREDVLAGDEEKIAVAIRRMAAQLPTYVTLKDVKKRWGHGQEDIFPVMQFEKIWGDMSVLPGMRCEYVVVPRLRGQQLKDPAQLDGWLRDGSAGYIEGICDWG